MKNSTKIMKMEAVVRTFTRSGYVMGDLFTLTVGDDVVKYDTREYYQGRGSKYNSNVRHGDINKTMSVYALNKAYAPIGIAKRECPRLREQRTIAEHQARIDEQTNKNQKL